MGISFDEALNIHPDALRIRAQRTEVLANNLANADTPNFKAQDIDFAEALRAAQAGNDNGALQRTHANHIATNSGGLSEPVLQYRVPSQPSLDGNTVDVEQERAAFAENAVRYQASLQFLQRRFNSLLSAIRGE